MRGELDVKSLCDTRLCGKLAAFADLRIRSVEPPQALQ